MLHKVLGFAICEFMIYTVQSSNKYIVLWITNCLKNHINCQCFGLVRFKNLHPLHIHNRGLLGTGVGLNMMEFCETGF